METEKPTNNVQNKVVGCGDAIFLLVFVDFYIKVCYNEHYGKRNTKR